MCPLFWGFTVVAPDIWYIAGHWTHGEPFGSPLVPHIGVSDWGVLTREVTQFYDTRHLHLVAPNIQEGYSWSHWTSGSDWRDAAQFSCHNLCDLWCVWSLFKRDYMFIIVNKRLVSLMPTHTLFSLETRSASVLCLSYMECGLACWQLCGCLLLVWV